MTDAGRARWRRWGRWAGRVYLLCYACAFYFQLWLITSMFIGGDRPPEWICEDLRHDEPSSGGVLDLRPVGIPCGFRPLAGPFSLFVVPAIAAPLFLPAVPVFGMLLWAVWIGFRDPWGGGPKVVLPEAEGAGVSPRPGRSPSGPGRS